MTKNLAAATITATGTTSSRSFGARFGERVTVRDFGALGNNSHDDTSAIQAAVDYAATVGTTVRVPAGTYKCTDNITMPVGTWCPDLEGEGWNCSTISFVGSGVTKGVFYSGDNATYPYCGTLRNLHLLCSSGAVRGVSYYGVNHPRMSRVQIGTAAGACVHLDYTLMACLEHCLFAGGGSATEGCVEVDHSTTFCWLHSRISGSQADAHAGLVIDRTAQTTILGGNIESAQTPIKISSKAQGTTGCLVGLISGIDLENQGNGHPYLSVGAGWSGSAGGAASSWMVTQCSGFPSGTTTTPYAVWLKNALGFTFENNNWALTGTPTATYYLDGAQNYGTVVRPHRNLFGYTFPWVMANDVHRSEATPLADWNAQTPSSPNLTVTLADADGVTPSVLLAAQGGTPSLVFLAYTSTTTIQRLLNFTAVGPVYVYTLQSATTLKHNQGGSGTFLLTSAADTLLTAGKMYQFFFDGTYLRQVGS